MKVSKLFLAALFVSLVSLAPPAFADTVYTYQGNPFSYSQGNLPACGDNCAITASFTVATPLSDNMAETNITPESFSISDGTITDDTEFSVFYVGTDPNGNINAWDLSTVFGSIGMETFSYPGDSADVTAQTNYFMLEQIPGTWTETDPTPTPEPSSLLLLSSGLIGLGFMKRKVFQN